MDKRLLGLARQNVPQLTALTGLHAVSAVLVVAQAALLAAAVDIIYVDGGSLGDVGALLGLLATAVAARSLLLALSSSRASALGRTLKRGLRSRLIRQIARKGPALSSADRTGSLLATAGEGTEAIEPFFRDLLPAVIHAVLVPLAVLLAVAPLDLLTAVILIVTAPLIPLFGALIGMAAGAQARKRYADMSRLSAHFYDVLQGLVTLKLFNRSKPQRTIIAEVTDAFRESTMTVLRTAFLSAFMLELLATLSIAVIAVEIGLRLLHGDIDFARALFILVVAPEFYLPIRQLAARFHNAANSAAAADKLFAVLPQTTDREADPFNAAPAHIGPITFDRVIVQYADGRTALNGIDMTVELGQYVALIGPSGAGKSTIASLLMRFIEPSQGQIFVGGRPITDYAPDDWRSLIAYLPQRPHIFNLTVADNVRLGRPAATDTDVWDALQRASADAFVRQLPQSVDTLCGEHGVRFSGGQARRIALARALLRQTPLLVLDEPTAHLDAETERAVANTLSSRLPGVTVIHIAHRLKAVENADRVIRLENGMVVDSSGMDSQAEEAHDYA